MSDLASVSQAIVDSTSTMIRSVSANAERLAPHAANALAARAVVSFIVPVILAVSALTLGTWGIKAALKSGEEELMALPLIAVVGGFVCLVFSFIALGDAAAAWRDPVGFMILKLLNK